MGRRIIAGRFTVMHFADIGASSLSPGPALEAVRARATSKIRSQAHSAKRGPRKEMREVASG